MRDDKSRLLDILEAMELLDKNLSFGKSLHELDELKFMGVVRCIEIIGEACRYLSEELKNKYPEIPWRQIANMRNILAHQYFNIDTEKVEKAIREDLPKIKEKVKEILEVIE
ncbi:MAG: DUF86 domain-containing protein [Candidatus Melainabacteria bacterium]|nr:DUF86 domain-containing protein [Candidatus Melainabacteria bacterium]